MTTSKSLALGTALRTLRRSAGLTLEDVGRLAGISYPYLSNVERGKVRPSADWVREVLAAIGQHVIDTAEDEAA